MKHNRHHNIKSEKLADDTKGFQRAKNQLTNSAQYMPEGGFDFLFRILSWNMSFLWRLKWNQGIKGDQALSNTHGEIPENCFFRIFSSSFG